jgi:hypothetical protein
MSKTEKHIIGSVLASALVVGGLAVACEVDRKAGYFKCELCDNKFTPTRKDYMLAPHAMGRRYLKCPRCEAKSICEHITNDRYHNVYVKF